MTGPDGRRRRFRAVLLAGALAAAGVLFSGGAGAGDETELFLAAIRDDRPAELRELLIRVPDVNVATEKGRTALMIAAKYGDVGLVRALIDRGADVNATNHNGGTALMYSALPGSVDSVELLIASGSEINAVGRNGWNALMIAAAKGHAGVIGVLIDHGADANAPDVYGWTPLMRAVYENHSDAVDALLASPDIALDRQDDHGATALHHAVSIGNESLVTKLLQAGARRSIQDAEGLTALQRAESLSSPDIAALLAE